MHFHDLAKVSLQNLRRNRVRTALSLLGIVIGVFSVTIIISLGVAVKGAIIGYVNSFVGQDLISVNPAVPGASKENSMMALMMGASAASLTYDDVQAIAEAKNVPGALAVNGTVTGQDYVRFGNKSYRSMSVGVSATYPKVQPIFKFQGGRFFTESEEKGMVPVVVLGSKVADKLFGAADPLGQKVKIRDYPVQVIGVLKPAGNVFGMDLDSIVVLPLRYMQKRLIGNDHIMEMHIRAASQERVSEVVADIERVLRKRHSISDPSKDDFIITTAQSITDRLNTITDVVTWFLGFLAAISLLVGGIGIMNIMLVSVTERIREVGLRKALGAKSRDIMLQFLAEAVTLTTAGGLIGGGLGFLATLGVVLLMRLNGLDVPYMVSVGAFLGAALVAAATGIVFGISPARQAARLDPITSLRYE